MTRNNWGFQNSVHIKFGLGSLAELPDLIGARSALLVTTPGSTARGVTDRVSNLLSGQRITVFDQVSPNPDVRTLDRDSTALRGEPIDVIIGLGGGSAIDTAKAFSTLLVSTKEDALSHHFKDGDQISKVKSLPLIAVPTTAGSGSEVTPFATIWDNQENKKYSIDSTDLYAESAILDPELSTTIPSATTISSGLDALSHALESIWNWRSTPPTTIFATEAIRTILKILPLAVGDPGNLNHRSELLKASLYSGLAISQTRTALAHSMSYPLTCHYGLPHGLACGFTLPAILEFNFGADDGRLESIANNLGFSSREGLKDSLTQLLVKLGVSELLNQYVSNLDSLFVLVPEMLNVTRSSNNLREADFSDVSEILKQSWMTL